jgi:two-component system cell cycle response regulator DivK
MAVPNDGPLAPTILVVEDNLLNRELVRDLLLTAGMKVVEAPSGQEGLQVAAKLRPSLILLDIRLPGMDGFAVLKQLKADPVTAPIPVVAFTAQAMVGDREQALAAGFSAYIPKPIDTRTLADSIRALLGSMQGSH